MNATERIPLIKDQDDLRLLALSRIPRCAACSRFRALRQTHETGRPLAAPLPPSPAGCDTPYCAPLVERYAPRETRRGRADETRGGYGGRTGATALCAAAPAFHCEDA